MNLTQTILSRRADLDLLGLPPFVIADVVPFEGKPLLQIRLRWWGERGMHEAQASRVLEPEVSTRDAVDALWLAMLRTCQQG